MMSSSRLTTIPRLELSAAALSVKLDVIIRRELDCQIDKSVFWTDSTIVLGYTKNVEKKFRTFVANRITLIHSESTPSQWPEKQNTVFATQKHFDDIIERVIERRSSWYALKKAIAWILRCKAFLLNRTKKQNVPSLNFVSL